MIFIKSGLTINRGGDSVANSCDDCPANYNLRDQDLDGIPDGCDDCNVTLVLTQANGLLSGTYRASQSITLGPGVQFPTTANIILRAPLVKVSEYIEPKAGVIMTIDPGGCLE